MGWKGKFPAVYPILDASFLDGAEEREVVLRRMVRDLAGVGIEILQYRNKTGSGAEILADAGAMREAAAGRMLLIMNDRPELAMDAGFDGVHVGQTDLRPAEARAIVGPGKIVGISTHNEAQLQAADSELVDYIAIGPVFATATKADPDPVVGLEGVRRARGVTKKPLIAIGGITVEKAAAVGRAGADSVAIISAIFKRGSNPAELAADFLRVFQRVD